MVKICPRCQSTWAGGLVCEDCGTRLDDPFDAGRAQTFPDKVWQYIRLQYGARRGMIVRVLAYLIGPVVAFVLLREAMAIDSAWRWPAIAGAMIAGVVTWWTIHWLAGKAVRLWVLRRGRVSKRKLARALIKKAMR
jgi:MFS family permease